MTGRELFFASLKGEETGAYPFMPITMMFAADKAERSYRDYAMNAEVQVSGQMAVAEQFDTAHVSVISDPAVEASDLGASVMISEDAPPAIKEEEALLQDKSFLSSLKPVKPEDGRRMSNRLEALRLLKERGADSLVIEGWVEGPCAEASDLRGINRLMMDFFDDAAFVGDLMDLITEQAIGFALKQIEAGADLIGIGDAASSLIGPDFYNEFVIPRMHRYVKAIHDAGGLVRLHICGNTNPLFPYIADLGVDMIDLDSMAEIPCARTNLGPRVALAGNLDPVSELKDSSPDKVLERVKACRDEAAGLFIVGAGCEVPRGTPDRNLHMMSDFARNPEGV